MNNYLEILKKNGKSFYWAGQLLPKKYLIRCAELYSFCRLLDDIADSKIKTDNLSILKNILNLIKKDDYHKLKNYKINIPDYLKKSELAKAKIIDLIDGLIFDQKQVRIKNERELILYCYRVAGTVGLMMSKILRVKNKEALKGAIDLGIAMQLTNIARDVCEDKARNRQYVDHNFLAIREIIDDSQLFYGNSFKSISDIPVRSRFSVIVARRIYRKIGDYILKQKNINNYNKAGKIYVPIFEKVIQTFLSIFDFVKLFFIKNLNKGNQSNHNILEQEININERI